MLKLRAMKNMSFTVFSYNATVLLIQPNPSHVLENAIQPNPWMDPTHVHLCSTSPCLCCVSVPVSRVKSSIEMSRQMVR